MWDKYYAVQFRSMHTAIHNIMIFSVESTAVELFNILNETETFPEGFISITDGNFVDVYEINFRNPPERHEGIELIYVNRPVNTIPDVYNF